MKIRTAYIARYPLNQSGTDLVEEILFYDTNWSSYLRSEWERLMKERREGEPMLQGWYSHGHETVCMAETNQPFNLD